MTERSEASELPVAKEAVAVSEEEAEAVVEPVGSEGGVLSAEDLFADDDWDGRIERSRRYLTDRNFRIGPDMTDEDVMSAAEMLVLSEAHIVSDLDVLRGPTTETQAEFDNLPGVEKLKRLIELTGGRYYRGDELKRELAENAPTVVEENPDAAEKLDRLLVRMDEVETRRVEWLWRDRIPLRAVTLLAGIGGLGKSQASLAIAGEATRGELTGHPETVLLFTAEDDLEAVVKPRLEATEADAALVFALRMNADLWLPDGIDELRALVRQTQARLIIFDPLVAFVAAETETHKERDVRVLIRGLHDVAAEFDAAVVAVMHFKKGAEADALYRVSGAAGFGNAARSVLAAARDPRDETRRVLVHVKNNYGVEKPAIRFEVQQVGESSAVVFGAEDASLTQREVFGQTPGPAPDAQDEAVEFLRSELADGQQSVNDVEAAAKAAGITVATLRRAKKKLGIRTTAVRGEDNKITGWVCALPEGEGASETPDV